MTEQTPKPGLFNRDAANIEQRKRCVIATRDYYQALDAANAELAEADKLLDKFIIIEQRKYKIYQQLYEKVSAAHAAADWQVSLFFQGIGHRLEALREQLKAGLEKHSNLIEGQNTAAVETMQAGKTKVYVSLYLTDGKNLSKWASVLNSLSRLSIGRPVYAAEQAIIDAIRAKPDQTRDAYAAVLVSEKDIIAPIGGITPKDRLGNELLTIREGTILPHHIIEFVQIPERTPLRYRFVKGQLIPNED